MAVDTDLVIALVSGAVGAVLGALAGSYYTIRVRRRWRRRKLKEATYHRMLLALDDIMMICHTLEATLKIDLDEPTIYANEESWQRVLTELTGKISLFAGTLAADQAMREVFPEGVGEQPADVRRRSAHRLRAKAGEILLLRIADDSREVIQDYSGFLSEGPSEQTEEDLSKFLEELGQVQVALATAVGREEHGLKSPGLAKGSGEQLADLVDVLERLEAALLKDLQGSL